MKLIGAVAILAAGTWPLGARIGKLPSPVITVCTNPGAELASFYRAQGTASQLLKEADVRIEWQNNERACAGVEHGIIIDISVATPGDLHPGALAYALPFERTRIVVFYDRVQDAVEPSSMPALLGHVLAHEIVHILQGVDRHAPSGIMKPRWDARDYKDMQLGRLTFTADDIALIHRGLRS
jgi:hypothetical protein